MSDLMLLGILRMPESSIEGDALSLMQFVNAARGAADRIQSDVKIIEQLRADLEAAAADKRDALTFRDLMAAVVREIEHGEYDRPYRGIENAPGHAHAVPGIWDSDNGTKAGTQCAWCATWNSARAALAQRQEGS